MSKLYRGGIILLVLVVLGLALILSLNITEIRDLEAKNTRLLQLNTELKQELTNAVNEQRVQDVVNGLSDAELNTEFNSVFKVCEDASKDCYGRELYPDSNYEEPTKIKAGDAESIERLHDEEAMPVWEKEERCRSLGIKYELLDYCMGL